MSYAAGTNVSVDRSLSEVQRLLERFGCDQFGFAQEKSSTTARRTLLMFRWGGYAFKLDVPLPDPASKMFTHTPKGQRRTQIQAMDHFEREVCRRYRVLVLWVKAQLEAISLGVVRMEEAFLNWIMIPGGKTVGDEVRARLPETAGGKQISLLPERASGAGGSR